MRVCTKERKGITAAVLMATPCTKSLGGESGGQRHFRRDCDHIFKVYFDFFYFFPCVASTVMDRRNVQNVRVRGAWSGSIQLQGMLLFTLTTGMAMCEDDKAAAVRDVLREHGLEEAEAFVTSYCWEGVRGLARLQRLEAKDIDQVVGVHYGSCSSCQTSRLTLGESPGRWSVKTICRKLWVRNQSLSRRVSILATA